MNRSNHTTATSRKDSSLTAINSTYYRYYTGSGNVEFIITGSALARLMATDHVSIAGVDGLSDAELETYANNYFTYRSDGTVLTEVSAGEGCSICGGQGTTTYSVIVNPHFDPSDRNSWEYERVQALSDGTVNTEFYSGANQLLLEDTWDGSTTAHSITYNKYDAYGNVIQSAEPAAIASYSSGGAELTVTFNAHSGLITDYNYYLSTDTQATSTTPGGVTGYLKSTDVKQGSAGALDLQSSQDYRVVNNVVYVNSTTTYGLAGQNDPRTTNYTYTFSGGVMTSMMTALPAASASTGGTSTARPTSTEVYDSLGRVVWTIDAAGSFSFTGYYPATGAVNEEIDDVDSALPSAGAAIASFKPRLDF